MRRARAVALLLALLGERRVCAKGGGGSSKEEYDSHGCCLTCGYEWCEAKSRCLEEWMSCDMGVGDLASCTYTWAGLTWDLSPLRDAADG